MSTPFRVVGKTTAVSAGASATSEALVNNDPNIQCNYVSLINTGATSVAVKFGPTGVGISTFQLNRLVVCASSTQQMSTPS